MVEVKVLNKEKRIASIIWSGIATVEEVEDSTKQLRKVFEEFGRKKYYIIVDCREMKVNHHKLTEAFVIQRQELEQNILLVASVVTKAIMAQQLKNIREDVGEGNEVFFQSTEEAYNYIIDIQK